MNIPKIEIYRDEARRYRWRRRAGNGRITASGESHPTPSKARRAARQNILPPYTFVDLWRDK